MESMAKLRDIVARLRTPDGCPWDREQTAQSLVPYLLEEAHEAAEAILRDDRNATCEELGDVLLNIVMQTQIAEEQGRFDLDTVIERVADKMLRRHPHVFGDQRGADLETIKRNWRRIKKEEKPARPTSALRDYPASLPALAHAQRIGQDAARVGFDWADHDGPLDKVAEEIAELRDALTRGGSDDIHAEIGDLLLALTSVCRHVQVDAEQSLRDTIARFRRRFGYIEAHVSDLSEASLADLEALWQAAKAAESAAGDPASSDPDTNHEQPR